MKTVEERLSVLETVTQEIKDNHLQHIKQDVNRVEQKVDRIDNRVWWILWGIVASILIPMLKQWFM